ncbi:Smr/MutS family protein [Helicobacter sp. 11S02629-2]|uniref:endonuclease MutS2 n=1 Tax=Helicobacter sp. 11S02629-2 TaxID=1476195 RepID=UPI000BA51772|nr:Smr/MutS family protein [Helicobacter sp. 11S02629-2]
MSAKNLYIDRLGLSLFIESFLSFFSRQMDFKEVDSIRLDYKKDLESSLIKRLNVANMPKLQDLVASLESITFEDAPSVKVLSPLFLSLKKGGYLGLKDLYEFVKIARYFLAWGSKSQLEGELKDYFTRIVFPSDILEFIKAFDKEGKIKEGFNKDLDSINLALEASRHRFKDALISVLNQSTLQEYLVDKQVHLVEGRQALLLRAGFSNVLKARTIARSNSGFFYVVPNSTQSALEQVSALEDKLHLILEAIAKELSSILRRHMPFVSFLDREFDFLDAALARINFARAYNYEFVRAKTSQNLSEFKLAIKDYKHPSIKNAKSFSLSFDKQLLLITGVNAGGKTMLLKSILSASFCAKYFIPMAINAAKSNIPYIKHIELISQDPQDSKQDISTFSGRIKELSSILNLNHMMLGIDEIEIGTDTKEASSLYKTVLEHMLNQDSKIIITTHHKELASLLASNPKVALLAAMFDIKNSLPTYEFIEGIGKSYAFESALKYGIPASLVKKAQDFHGEDSLRLDNLIEAHAYEITKLKQTNLELETLKKDYAKKMQSLEVQTRELKNSYQNLKFELQREYNQSIKELKMLLKKLPSKSEESTLIHKALTKVTKKEASKTEKELINSKSKSFELDEMVEYKGSKAKVIKILKSEYILEFENGLKLSAKADELNTFKGAKSTKTSVSYKVDAEVKGELKLDLHGLTQEEALEAMDSFMSNALLAGFNEVLIVHGKGNKILAGLVTNYLDKSPYVKGFVNAPFNLGGSGGKLVYL